MPLTPEGNEELNEIKSEQTQRADKKSSESSSELSSVLTIGVTPKNGLYLATHIINGSSVTFSPDR